MCSELFNMFLPFLSGVFPMEWREARADGEGVFESEDEVWKWLGWLTVLCT